MQFAAHFKKEMPLNDLVRSAAPTYIHQLCLEQLPDEDSDAWLFAFRQDDEPCQEMMRLRTA